MTIQERIEDVKNSYRYLYPFIDIEGIEEVEGWIYDVDCTQYFIDDKETYIKIIDSE